MVVVRCQHRRREARGLGHLGVMGQGALLQEKTPCSALWFQHLSEFTYTLHFMSIFGISLQIISKPLFNDCPALEDIYEVFAGIDLGKVVCDNYSRLVFAPALEGFEYQDSNGGVQVRCSFVYLKRRKRK